ncbi:MAG: GDSL-type esterase/lipase family protein [Thermodesulfobacteriota bacterium]
MLAVILCLDSVLAGLLMLEFYFARIHDQSDGFNLTHAGRAWFERHWRPVNSLGYRDAEPSPPGEGQTAVVVLGDSFAAGHGVREAADRFPEVAARALGPEFKVFNVSKVGWDTVDETKGLKSFPVKPKVVVLSYYLNDIFHAAGEARYPLHFAVNLPKGFMKFVVDNSALADFVYWRLARGGNLSGGGGTFWDTLKGAYADPAAWSIHAAELGELASYCKDAGIRLVAVIFPMLQAPGESAPLTGKVAAELAALGAEVIDLTPVFAGRNPRDLVVNGLDAHPNEAVHKEVGELLAKRLRQSAAASR